MPIELKDSLGLSKSMHQAARRRAADYAHVQLSPAEVDIASRTFIAQQSKDRIRPPAIPGALMGSIAWSDFVRDAKMTLGIVASQGDVLEREIFRSSHKNFAILDDLQREALALDAFVTEEEVKVKGRYTSVHFNSFVRAGDSQLPYDNPKWLTDYKTGLPFTADNMSEVLHGTGVTLPLRQRVSVPIRNVVLVGEETDVGDTAHPIVSSSPRNLLIEGRSFRHVIIRAEHDTTGKVYNHTPSYCTLLLELGSLQLVNELTVSPLGHSTVYIDSISYLNESGEENDLTEVELSNEVKTTVLFEPVRARSLRVKFRQYAPVTYSNHESGDLRARELNQLLKAADFSQLLDDSGEQVEGRVYDFSMEAVEVGLRVYENLGVFRSQPLEVRKPLGASYEETTESIVVSQGNTTYGADTLSMLAGDVLLEKYLGIDLKWSSGGGAFNDLVPIPDGRVTQREFLPIFSGESKVKLYPDLMWNLQDLEIEQVYWFGFWAWVKFANPHQLYEVGSGVHNERIHIIAGPGEGARDYNFSSTEWYVLDANWLLMKPEDILGLAAGALTYSKITPYGFVEAHQPSPFDVYQNDTLLSVGTDYQISFDRGASWLDKWPRDKSWLVRRARAKAGTLTLKFLNPKHSDTYWCSYRPLRNQQLSKKPGVTLLNGRVVFEKRLREASGTITTVVVTRADSANVYLTPVLLYYFLRVREYVDQ